MGKADYIDVRVVSAGEYMIEKNATVRETAREFGVSKSTIHIDVTERLNQLNPFLARRVRKVLDNNLSVRHIRGGMATKRKYEGRELCVSYAQND